MANKERIKKWVDALRSGKYKQARGALRENVGEGEYTYCCLGVATDIYEKETGNEIEWKNKEYLPLEVMDWYGLEANNPELTVDSYDYPASELNDELFWSFRDIADAVEHFFLND